MFRRVVLAGALVCAEGCTERPAGFEDDSSSSPADAETGSPSSGMPGSTSHVVESSGGVDVDTSSSAGSSSSEGGSSDDGWPCGAPGSDERLAHCSPDGGGVTFECDVLAQDCPVGEKCMPWANDGGGAWNATRCTPLARPADPVGAPCLVEGSALSGIDSCVLGTMCWDVDPVTNEGVCTAMCSGTADDPTCEEPDARCMVSNDGAIALCLPSCDALLQDCTGGTLCIPDPTEERWICVPPGGDVLAVEGEPCEYLNVCVAGTVCAAAEVVPGCDASLGCCTSVCELGGEACATPGTECAPWYEPGMAPPSFETLGICAAVPEAPAEGWVGSSVDHVLADYGS